MAGKKNAGKGAKGKGKDDAKDTADAGKETPVKGAQRINVRHILCSKQGKMLEAKEKLDAGVSFDVVAKEFSEDKARAGGALGWKGRGELDADFEKAAFEMEASTTAKPKYTGVKTEFGYHILMVEGRK